MYYNKSLDNIMQMDDIFRFETTKNAIYVCATKRWLSKEQRYSSCKPNAESVEVKKA